MNFLKLRLIGELESINRLMRAKYIAIGGDTSAIDENQANQRAQRVLLILDVPIKAEPLLTLGFLQCLSTFFAIFFIVPVQAAKNNDQRIRRTARLRLFIVILVTLLTTLVVDMGRLYHSIRGQSIVKIYFLYNAVDLADRMLASVGQDIIENGLYLSKEEQDWGMAVCVRILIALAYTFLHSFVLLCQVSALNVAFNSHNKALFAVWLSNNFAEVKQAVFKKFERRGLLRICLNDVRERVHFLICLAVISIRNMAHMETTFHSFVLDILPYLIIIFLAELVVDYVKHIAIVRFNNLRTEVYNEFLDEVLENGRISALSLDGPCGNAACRIDYIDRCCRMTSFSLLPAAVTFARTGMSIFKYGGGVHIVRNIMLLVCALIVGSVWCECALFAVTDRIERIRKQARRKLEPNGASSN